MCFPATREIAVQVSANRPPDFEPFDEGLHAVLKANFTSRVGVLPRSSWRFQMPVFRLSSL